MSSSHELFGSLPAFLPNFLGGETLFSWGARYHRLSGNSQANHSSLQLFGNPRAGLKHDFPSHLDQFHAITQGLLGEPMTLAVERTLLGFYVPFLDSDALRIAMGQMRGPSVARLKSRLGLLASRVGAAHPLKACHKCIQEDVRKYGISRWSLEHQWPTVWVCRKHRRPLAHLRRSAQPKELCQWLLPEDIAESDWLVPGAPGFKPTDVLFHIADVSAGITQRADRRLDSQLLRYTYLLGAKRQGWLFPDGSLRLKELAKAFHKYRAPLQNIPGIAMITADGTYEGFLGLLMRQYPGRRHPVRHAVLIAFLFPSTDDFDGVYEEVRHFAEHSGAEQLHQLLVGEQHTELRRLVEDEHRSVSQAAQALGMSVGLAVRWSMRDGINYQKRPRVLTDDLEKRLLLLIHSGWEVADISRDTEIKSSYIRNYLAQNLALRKLWHERRLEKIRDSKRQELARLLEVHRGVPLKAIRRIPGNGFSWLVRNDQDWLIKNMPLLRKE